MFSKIATLGALAAMATSVAAHGTVTGMSVNGVYTTGWLLQYAYETDPPASVGWTEAALDNGYVSDYGSADIICHKNATNAQAYLNVTAGDEIVLYWTTWPDSHKGPVTSYLASCGDDCTTVDKTTLEFVKFDEAGLITPGDDQVWATDNLIANNNSWTVTVPSSIESGNWVLRHEILALHGAGSANGAQSYPFCINLDITGTGTESPTGTLGESLYTATDPGVLVNIYTDLESYTIPGPAIPSVWGGSDNSTANSATSSASVASSTSAASSVATVASTSATSTAVVASTSATSSAVSVASSTAVASTSAATSASVSSISTQVVAATSTSAATSAAITSAASTASAASASASVASSLVSAISSLTTALPSSVLTSAAPTATATTSSGATVSTAGMTVAELLDLLKQILVDLLGSSSTSSKARRHARAF